MRTLSQQVQDLEVEHKALLGERLKGEAAPNLTALSYTLRSRHGCRDDETFEQFVDRLAQERDQERKDREYAWQIIAAMHEAAVGEKRAPSYPADAAAFAKDVSDALANGRAALKVRDDVSHALTAAMVPWKKPGTDGSQVEFGYSTLERVQHLIAERDFSRQKVAQLQELVDALQKDCANQKARADRLHDELQLARPLKTILDIAKEAAQADLAVALKTLRDIAEHGNEDQRLQAAHMLLTLVK